MRKFVGTDFDAGMKFGHDFLKIQWLMKFDQQRVFNLEESVWTGRQKKNGLRFRIYRTHMSSIDPGIRQWIASAVFQCLCRWRRLAASLRRGGCSVYRRRRSARALRV